jgi:hypothetical protein
MSGVLGSRHPRPRSLPIQLGDASGQPTELPKNTYLLYRIATSQRGVAGAGRLSSLQLVAIYGAKLLSLLYHSRTGSLSSN